MPTEAPQLVAPPSDTTLVPTRPGRLLVFWWSAVIAALVVVSSVVVLLDPSVPYGQETENWATQARGQDIGNLLAVVTLLMAGWRHGRGSQAAALVWLGSLFYLIYAFAIYALAVHFNQLFLVYVAVLGLSVYGVICTIDALRAHTQEVLAGTRLAGYVLVLTGALFGLLWLKDLLPALIANRPPDSVVEAGLWVNPVHVLDLAVVLPALVLTGRSLLKGRPNGMFFALPWLVFSILMGSSIVATMLLMSRAGLAEIVPPLVMVSLVVLASLYAALRMRGRASTSHTP